MFRRHDRYGAFASYHDEAVVTVERDPSSGTPDVATSTRRRYPGVVLPSPVGARGQSKRWRNLRIGDALADAGVTDAQTGGGTIDYETLPEIDPDAIVVGLQGEITDEYVEGQSSPACGPTRRRATSPPSGTAA